MYYNNLYEARTNAHITQSEIANKLDMNVTVYGRYERGERDIPLSLAAQMANELNVSLDYIARRTENPMGYNEDTAILQRTLINPILKNPQDKVGFLNSCIEALREEQRQSNERVDNAIDEIMKKIDEIYPENK